MIRALISVLLFFGAVYPVEAVLAADETENTEYAYGTVISTDLVAGVIIIKEQDYDSGTETSVTYCVVPETVFENINSLNEITADNDVDISYTVGEEGKKVIKFISVYKPELEDEEE